MTDSIMDRKQLANWYKSNAVQNRIHEDDDDDAEDGEKRDKRGLGPGKRDVGDLQSRLSLHFPIKIASIKTTCIKKQIHGLFINNDFSHLNSFSLSLAIFFFLLPRTHLIYSSKKKYCCKFD